MSLKDEIEAEDDAIALARERVAKEGEARRAREASAALRLVTQERDALQQQLDFVLGVQKGRLTPPRWTSPKRVKAGHRGIICSMLTDTHFDEIVDPSEVDGINAYDRRIAEMRLKRWTDKTIIMARDYISGVEYDGIVVPVGGDIFSGNIHEELKETNEDTLYAAVVHWSELLEAAFTTLADEFGSLYVPVTYGNHGRSTRKPVAKRRAKDNVEWLLYNMLAKSMRGDSRISFNIPTSADTRFDVYGTRFVLHHGDQFKGGSGISGMMAPLMLGHHRKTRRSMAVGQSFDWMVQGHLHQYFHGKGIIVGGTMKGTDEYAFVSNFAPEPPQQAFWIVTPENGITIAAPILVSDRKAEGW